MGSTSAETLAVASDCTIVKGDALRYLKGASASFDLVFLDPPFDQADLLREALALLAEHHLVGQYVYAEARTFEPLEQAQGFKIVKRTQAGDTVAALLAPNPDIAADPAQG